MSDPPSFSVVVPAYNRPAPIRRCVAALAALAYPRDRFEVVVVDDGSATPLEPEIRAAAAEADPAGGLRLRVVRQENAGPAAARNRGAAEATGRYLAFTDDDCVPRPDWLARFADRLAHEPDLMLGGAFINGLPGNAAAAASHVVIGLIYELGQKLGHGTGPDATWLFVTANLCVPREAFLTVGGFDESFPLAAGEDFDFCHHFQFAGHRAAWCPQAAIDHFHPMTTRAFWRQHFGYGRGSLQFRVRATQRRGSAATANFGWFQLDLAKRIVARIRGPREVKEGFYVGLSQLATTAGAATEALRMRRGGGGKARRGGAAPPR